MTLKIREEAGLHLVTLLTTLQEAELALADPMAPGDESNKARKELDKLHGKLMLNIPQLQLFQSNEQFCQLVTSFETVMCQSLTAISICLDVF